LNYVYIGNVSGNVIDNGSNKYKLTNVILISNEIPGDLVVGGKSYYSAIPYLSSSDSLSMVPKRYADSLRKINTVPSGFSVNPTGAANMLLGGGFSFNSYAGTTGGGIGYNAYLDSASGWKYRNNGTANLIWSDASGAIIMYTAPSGVAGATPTLTPQFSISNAGLIRLLSTTDKAGSFMTQDATGFLYKRTASETLADIGALPVLTPYVTKAVSYTATATDRTIEVTATGTTQTLPTAVGIAGKGYIIKLTASGSATVATTSSQTIDGSTTYSLSAQYKYVFVQSNGANWIIIGNN
jgi:hypothetical protein